MRRRLTAKSIPPRWPFVSASVPGVEESPWWFRLPRATRMTDVFGPYTALFEGGSVQADDLPRLPIEAARIVGALWAHPTLELDSDLTDGEALLDEFHDAGLSEASVIHLATGLFQQCADRAITEREVSQRADFFGVRTQGPSMPMSSTLNASDGSATTEGAAPGTT